MPLEVRVWTEAVLLPPSSNTQGLSLGNRGEQLGIEEFIPEPAFERLSKAALPWGSRLDVGRRGAAALASAPQPMGDELGPVWPDEDSHSPWTGFRGPRHPHKQQGKQGGVEFQGIERQIGVPPSSAA